MATTKERELSQLVEQIKVDPLNPKGWQALGKALGRKDFIFELLSSRNSQVKKVIEGMKKIITELDPIVGTAQARIGYNQAIEDIINKLER